MKTESNEPISRRLIGILLASGLSDRELEALAKELGSNREFVFELSNALMVCLDVLRSAPRSAEPPEVPEGSLVDVVLDIMNTNGVTRRDVILRLGSIKSMDLTFEAMQKMSTRDILGRFFRRASRKQADDFLRFLTIGAPSDPYLKGIEKR